MTAKELTNIPKLTARQLVDKYFRSTPSLAKFVVIEILERWKNKEVNNKEEV